MFHMKGLKGKIDPTYGGEIDVLPTLLNLLGIKNQDTIQFGHDLLSKNAPQLVAQRNGDINVFLSRPVLCIHFINSPMA